ncbi:MAG TPA: VOC family protein [Ktedonobacterales bacterium]
MRLTTARLLVEDFPAVFAFWRDVMALPVAFGPDSPGAPPGYAFFTVDETGAAVELMERTAFATALGDAAALPVPVGHEAVLVLKVDDVDATHAACVARGATAVAGPRDRPEWGARVAHLSDPEGHLIELYAMLQPGETPTA